MLWLIFISCAVLTGYRGEPVDPTDQTDIVVEVPKGASARNLGPTLAEAGAIDDPESFTGTRIHEEGGCIKQDVTRSTLHELQREIAALCGAPIVDSVPFTILELDSRDRHDPREGGTDPAWRVPCPTPARFRAKFRFRATASRATCTLRPIRSSRTTSTSRASSSASSTCSTRSS